MISKLKKFLFIVFVFLIATSCGCSKDTLEIVEPVQDFLEMQEIYSSKITHIDYKNIEKLNIPLEDVDVSLICNRVDETLEVDYSFVEIKDAIVQKGNTVCIDYKIINENQKEVYSDTNVKVVIGTGCFDNIIENALLNHKAGDTVSLSNSIITNTLIATYKNVTVKITIKGIYKYTQTGSETLLEKHGFISFEDYYIYLYNIASDELKNENIIKQKYEFFNQTIKNCNFMIDDNELTSFSLKTVLSHEEQAALFGLTLEEYYTNILGITENEFFKKITIDSEYEIKKMLVVGALAQHYNIIVNDEIFEEFCRSNKLNLKNDKNMTEAYYCCLEEQVISYFL